MVLSIIVAGTMHTNQVAAQTCSSEGQCLNGYICSCARWGPGTCEERDPITNICTRWDTTNRTCEEWDLGGTCGGGAGTVEIGNVDRPSYLNLYDAQAAIDIGDGFPNGIVKFVSRLINVLNIFAGIFVMFQFIIAGYTYITSNGDPGAHRKVGDQLFFAAVGLVLIVASYTLAGLIGLVFFGDATFILQPQLRSAVQ